MSKFTVVNITPKFICFEKDELSIELPTTLFDTMMLHVGDETDLQIVIPYGISSQRRSDIREHHRDEALNGNL